MVVSGRVKMQITVNVCGLETDAVEVDKWGDIKITDPDKFFIDWQETWSFGSGELEGASVDERGYGVCDLEVEEVDD